MIQDIFSHRFDNRYDGSAKPDESSKILYFQGEDLLLVHKEIPLFKDLPVPSIYAFSIDKVSYFLALSSAPLPPGGEYVTVRKMRYEPSISVDVTYASWIALQLIRWMRNNKYCGRCGHEMIHKETERALFCSSCGYITYPRINPAVIAAVTWKDSLLLARYANRPIPYYVLVAGFAEIGETLEDAVAREVKEETGLEVTNIRYYKSQHWPLSGSMVAGFFCDVKGDPVITLDTRELKEARWFKREDVILQPDDYALTNEMMKIFKEHKNPCQSLEIKSCN